MAKNMRAVIEVNDGTTYIKVSTSVLKSFRFFAILTILPILKVLNTEKVLLRSTPEPLNAYLRIKDVSMPTSVLETIMKSIMFHESLN